MIGSFLTLYAIEMIYAAFAYPADMLGSALIIGALAAFAFLVAPTRLRTTKAPTTR